MISRAPLPHSLEGTARMTRQGSDFRECETGGKRHAAPTLSRAGLLAAPGYFIKPKGS